MTTNKNPLHCTACGKSTPGKRGFSNFGTEIAVWAATIIFAALSGLFILIILPVAFTLARFIAGQSGAARCHHCDSGNIVSAQVHRANLGRQYLEHKRRNPSAVLEDIPEE